MFGFLRPLSVRRRSLRRLLAVVSIALVVCLAAACDGPEQTQTELFEQAELSYRSGDYDLALNGYQAFLRTYPDSPLAETAELRIRCINREVRSMMARKDMPRPTYVGESPRSNPSKSAGNGSTRSKPSKSTDNSTSDAPDSGD